MAETESNGTCKTSPTKEEAPVVVKKVVAEPTSTESEEKVEKTDSPAKNGHEKTGKHHIEEVNGDEEDSNDAEQPDKKKVRPAADLPDVVASGDEHSNPAAISEASDDHRDEDEDDDEDVGEGPEEDEEDSDDGNE